MSGLSYPSMLLLLSVSSWFVMNSDDMMYHFILLVIASQVDCLQETENRIVGGQEVDPPHKYPFQVNIIGLSQLKKSKLCVPQVYFAADGYACAGSILDDLHVLTATHCLYGPDGDLHDPDECAIVAGAHVRPGGGWR